ncbi:hypothetical protein [Actinoplanes couchii]|uniref:Uncharacterized protein n=1 Tax=Actinoplanes couchii TaxID=403638 RepID=A0ABQ3XCR7_9ACTN|nr:hypothetical protein [Actinoplanes couchii]MDR6323660.1 hypothetical protein [Actinoplanes couchii]GID56175.1 hypothetical protein Aco03nite_045790 [Actinoplanes couchii]
MSDQFSDLFTQARPAAVSEIRPPGADAARRTVRGRRRRRNTLLAAVAVVALFGVLVIRPDPAPQPDILPAELVQQARNALGEATGPVAVEKSGEVRKGWSYSGDSYLGEQTLTLVCAGAGSVTLAITGTPVSENPSQDPIDISWQVATCSDKPVTVQSQYMSGPGLGSIEYTIVAVSGTGAFAFRVLTTDTGEPMTTADNRANPTAALHLTEQESNSQFGMIASVPADGTFAEELPAWIGGRFTVAAACAGLGTLKVAVKQARDGKTVDTWELPCRWPPKRYDWKPARGVGALELHVEFEESTESLDDADFSFQFAPK